jgi:hypothetical protein
MFHVEPAVRQATTHCPNNLSCLSGRAEALCRILASIEGERLFIVCGCPERACPYRQPEDGREACTCPVRIRIYERYRL